VNDHVGDHHITEMNTEEVTTAEGQEAEAEGVDLEAEAVDVTIETEDTLEEEADLAQDLDLVTDLVPDIGLYLVTDQDLVIIQDQDTMDHDLLKGPGRGPDLTVVQNHQEVSSLTKMVMVMTERV